MGAGAIQVTDHDASNNSGPDDRISQGPDLASERLEPIIIIMTGNGLWVLAMLFDAGKQRALVVSWDEAVVKGK